MTTLIIGSTAAKFWYPEWQVPKDFDAFSDKPWGDEAATSLAKPGQDLGDFFWDDRLYELVPDGKIASATPNMLYTIKFSHAYWELRNGSWNKHMNDMLLLQDRGATLLPRWHDVLFSVWEDKHGKKKVDLTQEADEFFADAVPRIYEHDSIHRSVAYQPGRPLYEVFLKDGKSVQMDMDKVWESSWATQIKMFREEIYVTALERLIIPNNYNYSPGAAYQWALRRTITSLTKGRSATFLVENYRTLRKADVDYVAQHLKHKDMLVKL